MILPSLLRNDMVLRSGFGLFTETQVARRLDRHSATTRLTSASDIRISGAFSRTYLTASPTATLCFSPAALERPWAYRTIILLRSIQNGCKPFVLGLPGCFIVPPKD